MTNNQQPAESNELQERDARFDYGFRMKCDCGELSDLSAAGYIEREALDARIPCSHCGASIHFGRAVAGIRDRHDPALDNAAVARFAWYHSSTSPDWPSPDYASRFAAQVREAELRFGHRYGTNIQRAKALHVGTYEAAVENMLRRMHDQDDATSPFYLYRVSLDISAGRINDSYRDENNEQASQISLDELQALGLDAIRYLNTHEAIGSVSLAIHPRAIRSLQVIPLPVTDLAAPQPQALSQRLRELEAELDSLQAAASEHPQVEESPLQALRRRMSERTGVTPPTAAVEGEWDLWEQVVAELTAHHLRGISPLVQRDFCHALEDWRRGREATVAELASFFAALAATLTRSSDVMRRLAHSTGSTAGNRSPAET
jgi:hypothetical protein